MEVILICCIMMARSSQRQPPGGRQRDASFFLRRRTQHRALRILEAVRIHLLGSDCHNMEKRASRMRAALAAIGEENRRKLEHRRGQFLLPDAQLHDFVFSNDTRFQAFL